MLTENQVTRVWEKMVEAEVRSLYFADLAARYTKRKQIITGVSFFLSSGAASTLIAEAPTIVPLLMSVLSAIAGAYSIAVSLDRKAATMGKLHSTWNQLSSDYDSLWNHWYEDEAEGKFKELLMRGKDASEIGATEAPYDEKVLAKWRDRVYAQYQAFAA